MLDLGALPSLPPLFLPAELAAAVAAAAALPGLPAKRLVVRCCFDVAHSPPPSLLPCRQEPDPFTLIAGGVGSPGVVGLDAISHVPLLAVATADKLVRVVNYESRCGGPWALSMLYFCYGHRNCELHSLLLQPFQL